ncbi:prevent-host-death protein [Variovorax sp. LT1R20]|uniref:prevent-host-death protein n=1 Tax=Variovorax TaxID=34072 RepID=UPI00159DB471|nr:prevent-host-death protein [Variovorax boronicumulans]MDQ0013624.1 hypothetical protein [Variovorax boronicumulans]
MNSSTRVQPINDPKSHATETVETPSVRSNEEREAIPELLKVLMLGHHEIERGEFRSADEVFTELDQEGAQ